MKPYYEHAGITIYHADCRDVLPLLSGIDLVLTDPPYGIDGGRGGGNTQRGKGLYEFNGQWEDTREHIEQICVPAIQWCVTNALRTIVTPGGLHLDAYLKVVRPTTIGGFWTPASAGFTSWGATIYHPILYFGKDPRAGIAQSPSGIALHETAERNGHPCPKPLNAWKWLLNKGSLEGEMVLDPFLGSGTTLVAAKHLNRRAIGIEIEERYCEIAANRLSQEVMELAV